MSWNPKYALLILTSTIVTYTGSLLIDRARFKRLVLTLVILINLGILCYFKYSNFILGTVLRIANLTGLRLEMPYIDVVLPVGISFYTFQALSYSIDVLRGNVKAEKNFLKYALFVSFFPQLVAGPIERSKSLLSQIDEKHKAEFEGIRDGLMIMLWGFFLKLIIADRIATVVDTVIDNPSDYNWFCLLCSMVLFAFQIYCDFSGYSTIALGAAKVMGFRLTDNFDAPYYSKSVSEFWRRWHISLNTWFKDYLYIPLGGNRKGPTRKYLNTMIVFLTSGLWHGAEWHFVVWGGLNGLYQVVGEMLFPIKEKLLSYSKLNTNGLFVKFFNGVLTFILVDIAWLFFRTSGSTTAVYILQRIVSFQGEVHLFDDVVSMGLNGFNIVVMSGGLLLLLLADALKYKGVVIRKWICKKALPIRWLIILFGVLSIVVLGVYGQGYNEAAFIYFQF